MTGIRGHFKAERTPECTDATTNGDCYVEYITDTSLVIEATNSALKSGEFLMRVGQT